MLAQFLSSLIPTINVENVQVLSLVIIFLVMSSCIASVKTALNMKANCSSRVEAVSLQIQKPRKLLTSRFLPALPINPIGLEPPAD